MPIRIYKEKDIIEGFKIVEILPKDKHGHTFAKFKYPHCENIFSCPIGKVSSKQRKSCGCLRHLGAKKKSYVKENINHKMPEWLAWRAIIRKCYNVNNQYFEYFGKKGIRVQDSWLDENQGYINFLRDLGRKPGTNYFLSRKDENEDFTKDNCIWALTKNKKYNKRKAREIKKFFINGECLSFKELNQKYKITIQRLRDNYNHYQSDSELEIFVNSILDKRKFTNFKKEKGLIKLKLKLRKRISDVLKNKFNTKKSKYMSEILGCSLEELIIHLESQFTEGMTWENRGLFGWHIDHIIPISSGKTEEDIYKLSHYTNLQPLWAKDNLIKKDKIYDTAS